MEYVLLSDVGSFSDERISIGHVTVDNYISTENMVPNKGGVIQASSLPDAKKVSKYNPGDILLSNIRPYFKKIWFADCIGGCSNDVLVFHPNKDIDAKFLYYVLSDNNFFNYATLTSKGTKMPRGTKRAILKYWIPNLSLATQQKIASLLSAYDSQIENNQKRIKLLEQMAESLYKEWFVRFRFPGYENAEFEGGVPKGWVSLVGDNKKPKGWTYGELNQLGTFIRGKNITAAEMIEGQVPVISAGLEPAGYHNQANVCGPCLTISSSGANAGYLKYNLTDIWAADCSYYNNPDNIWFVYSSLKYLQPVISNLQCGAAQPHVYPKDVNRLCVILPPKSLITEYNRQSSLFFKNIHNLKNQIFLLTHQRDLLLPRLMSGKLSI